MAPNATHHFSCHSQKHHAKKKKAEIFGVEPQSPGLSLDVSQGLQLTKFDQVEELELVAPWSPWSLGLFSCFVAGTCSTRKYPADSLFVKAIGMIPLRTQDSLDVFTERVKMLEVDMTALAVDKSGKSLLWHAAYFNDTHAVSVVLRYGGVAARQLVDEPDWEYALAPYDLALRQRDPEKRLLKQFKRETHQNENPFYKTT